MRDKESLRKWARDWTKKRRESFFDGKSCIVCGSEERLEIHHRDPKLKVSHNIWSWTEDKRLVELAKCDVLCHNCHKEETIKYFKIIYSGEKSSVAKLTNKMVKRIRSLYNQGVRGRALCEQFPVHRTNIYRALRGTSFRNIG